MTASIPSISDPEGQELLDLGPCCACGKEGPDVRNVLALKFRAPVPGTGWGCVVCNLPPDGAMAVLCDDCVRKGQVDAVQYAVKGYTTDKQRIPVADLTEPFDHHQANHEAYEMVNAGEVEGVGQVLMESRPVVVGDQIADDLPYLEGFFRVKFVKKGARIAPISRLEYKRLEGQVAEVNVPYRTDTAGYTMIAMIMNKRNDEVALLEAMQLKEIMADIVKQFGWHFRAPEGLR